MLLEKLREARDFTDVELKIAQYLLKHLKYDNYLTAKELGKASFTSKASVLRLYKKLGFSTYNNFMQCLVLEKQEQQRLLQRLDSEPVSSETKMKDLMSLIPTIYEKTIINTQSLLNPTLLQRIVNRIRLADGVDIYGTGIVESIIDTSIFKFQSLGIPAFKHTNVNEHAVVALKKQTNRIAIIVSFTGKNELMVNAAQYLRKHENYLIGIGGEDYGDLKHMCNLYIPFSTETLIVSMEVLVPTIALTYILDLIYAGLLVSDYETQVKNAKQVIEYSRYHN